MPWLTDRGPFPLRYMPEAAQLASEPKMIGIGALPPLPVTEVDILHQLDRPLPWLADSLDVANEWDVYFGPSSAAS
jgi:hypothetical protein